MMTIALWLLLTGQVVGPETLLGNWQAESEEGRWARFEKDRAFLAENDQLLSIPRIVHEKDGVIVLGSWGRHTSYEWSVDDGCLSLQTEAMEEPIYYRRAESTPACFEIKPLAIAAPRDLEPAEIDELRAELEKRGKEDQRIRMEEHPDFEEVKRIDGENTARITELLLDIGPIGPDRFGDEAARAAFLIVQHSGDLPLMLGALPYYEEAVRQNKADGQHFALLYDRVQLNIGRRQKYGSQLGTDSDGKSTVMSLISRDKVDEYRREVGMGPLADYLKFFGDDVRFEDDIKYE